MAKKKKLAKYIVPAVAVVAIGVGLTVVLNLPEDVREKTDNNDATVTSEAKIDVKVDKKKVHQAEPQVNEKGEVKENGTGTLLEYVPKDIKEIEVENRSSSYKITSYTPIIKETDENGKEVEKTDTTQYTIVGYEDMTLREGQADAVANDVAKLEFTKIASADGKNSSDFGFDDPQATVTITYEDETTAKIIVGDKAPTNAGIYIKFGTEDTIYIVSEEAVDSLLYSLNDMISLDVTTSAESGDDASMTEIELGGTLYGDTVRIKSNSDDDTVISNYLITAPLKCYGDDSNISEIEAGIRGIYADSVVYVNPKDDTLKKYGLDKPYATIKATYPDATISLIASKPDSKGYCKLMVEGGNVVYKILSDSIKWTQKSLDVLRSRFFVDNTMKAVDTCDVSFGKNKYNFTLTTDTTTTTDDDGNENTTSETKIFLGDKQLDQGSFQTAFDYIHGTSFERKGFTNETLTGSPAMTIKFKYNADVNRSDDTMKFYEKDGKVYITVNNEQISYIYKKNFEHLQKLFTTAANSKA